MRHPEPRAFLLADLAAYLKALAAEERAEEAEGRAFAAWFSDRTVNRQGTARKAKSRANAANHRRVQAETPVWEALDAQPWDDSPAGVAARRADLEGFARALLAESPERGTR